MKKYLELVERHVQWLALGLGVVYLLWMAYSYLLQPPVSQDVPGRGPQTLSSIDPTILEGPVQQLQLAMKDKTRPTIAVRKFTNDFKERMQRKTEDRQQWVMSS